MCIKGSRNTRRSSFCSIWEAFFVFNLRSASAVVVVAMVRVVVCPVALVVAC